jgi:hypothetical protein
MKKQIKKLSLNKKTISNLSATEMSRQMGGSWYACLSRRFCAATKNGNTCAGHNTCQYTCL